MNTKIDKDYIYMKDYSKVKEELKEFKSRYTDTDLRSFAEDAICDKYQKLTGKDYPWGHDIIRADVTAFGYDSTYGTYFRVDLLLDGYSEICRLRYYTNLNLEIDTEAKLNQFKGMYNYTFSIQRYERDLTNDESILYSDVAI